MEREKPDVIHQDNGKMTVKVFELPCPSQSQTARAFKAGWFQGESQGACGTSGLDGQSSPQFLLHSFRLSTPQLCGPDLDVARATALEGPGTQQMCCTNGLRRMFNSACLDIYTRTTGERCKCWLQGPRLKPPNQDYCHDTWNMHFNSPHRESDVPSSLRTLAGCGGSRL